MRSGPESGNGEGMAVLEEGETGGTLPQGTPEWSKSPGEGRKVREAVSSVVRRRRDIWSGWDLQGRRNSDVDDTDETLIKVGGGPCLPSRTLIK